MTNVLIKLTFGKNHIYSCILKAYPIIIFNVGLGQILTLRLIEHLINVCT